MRKQTSVTIAMPVITSLCKEIEGKQPEFGIVVLDLNNLKTTNDEYGHEVGDRLIIAAATILSRVFPESPIFRIGGDEFLVILQGSDPDRYGQLLKQIEWECANTYINEDKNIPVSMAIGFARFDASRDTSLKDVFKRADHAMYEDKRKAKVD